MYECLNSLLIYHKIKNLLRNENIFENVQVIESVEFWS